MSIKFCQGLLYGILVGVAIYTVVVIYNEKKECEERGGVFVRQVMSITEPNVCLPRSK